jgi:UDP-perosamine 4-acetyltransferase
MKELRSVVVGAGGHASVVIEAVRAVGRLMLVGIVDPNPAARELLGIPVLGGDECLPAVRREGVELAIIAVGDNRRRQAISDTVRAQGFALPPVLHPAAFLSPSAVVGPGAVVMARAVVGTRARVGALAIINTGAIVEHDNEIGIAAHVAPGVTLAGLVHVGDRALVGVGSAVRPGIRIGADAIVGAGSAVVSDVGACAIVAGAPARLLRRPVRMPT